LHSILRGAIGWAKAGDNIPADHGSSTFFVSGYAVLLKIVNRTVADFNSGNAAVAALREDAGPALAAIG
jgi:hypothetical protein